MGPEIPICVKFFHRYNVMREHRYNVIRAPELHVVPGFSQMNRNVALRPLLQMLSLPSSWLGIPHNVHVLRHKASNPLE